MPSLYFLFFQIGTNFDESSGVIFFSFPLPLPFPPFLFLSVVLVSVCFSLLPFRFSFTFFLFRFPFFFFSFFRSKLQAPRQAILGIHNFSPCEVNPMGCKKEKKCSNRKRTLG